jgi:hypothetical protein
MGFNESGVQRAPSTTTLMLIILAESCVINLLGGICVPLSDVFDRLLRLPVHNKGKGVTQSAR